MKVKGRNIQRRTIGTHVLDGFGNVVQKKIDFGLFFRALTIGLSLSQKIKKIKKMYN